MDPIQRKDNFEIWRQRTNEIISKLGSLASTTQTVISEMPPPIAYAGDLWWDSSSGKLKIYYDDGNSKQWLDAFVSPLQPSMTTISDIPPQSPDFGDLWWDSSSGKLKIYYHDGDSCQWIDAFVSNGGGTSKAEVVVSENPPVSPFSGELWWDSSTGKLKIYYEDIDSSQWIDAFIYHNNSLVNMSISIPSNSENGELWWDSSTGKLKIYYDDGNSQQWIDAFIYSNNPFINVSETSSNSPSLGELWWNPVTEKLKIYYEDSYTQEWIDTFSYLNIVDVSETPKIYPSTGELWWDKSNEVLKIYYEDSDTQEWISSTNLILDFSEILDSTRDLFNIVEYDTSSSKTFHHKLPTYDWEINFTNLKMKSGKNTKLTVIVEQDSVGYIPNKIKINDNFVGIKWKSSTLMDSEGNPIPGSNSIDRITYDIYCVDLTLNDYIVLVEIENF